MKSKGGRRGKRSKKPLIVAGLVAFLAVDLALVAYALDGPRTGAAQTTEPGASSRPTASVAPSTPAEVTQSPTASATADLNAPTVFLSPVDATIAYRVAAKSCDTTGSVLLERTVDAGATWQSSIVTTDLRSPLLLQAVDSSYAYMVGLGGDSCVPGLTATYTSGVGFQTYPDRVAATWYLDTTTPKSVHSPVGDAALPCDAMRLATIDDQRALVLCSDRKVAETLDGGQTWSEQPTVQGAQSVAATADGYVIARTGVEGCVGVSLSSMPSGSAVSPTALGCASSFTRAAQNPGVITVGAGSGSIWITDGTSASVSQDGGVTW
jgi:hypothetical protein